MKTRSNVLSSSYRLELDRWLKTIDVKANVLLDIGASQLPIGPNRVRSWQVNAVFTADLPKPHADSPNADFDIDINEPFHLEYGGQKLKADVIFVLEVLDYVYDPITAFKNIYNHLKVGGVAYISSGLMYPTHNPIQYDSLRYTEFGLRRITAKTGLEVVSMIPRRSETDAIEQFWRRERMRAAKNYDHNITGWLMTVRRAE